MLRDPDPHFFHQKRSGESHGTDCTRLRVSSELTGTLDCTRFCLRSVGHQILSKSVLAQSSTLARAIVFGPKMKVLQDLQEGCEAKGALLDVDGLSSDEED